ncbi:hypothetical protein C1645_826032 [Glomus cerebriforme]|uniref:Uncharacterized protein n=1 Tax=Glomus cerebriforme TaxID=658196 RepID=A0A397SRB6_9GLOM|nr:hypothetical protein C1645_826032 [Glomus cerebriforme]
MDMEYGYFADVKCKNEEDNNNAYLVPDKVLDLADLEIPDDPIIPSLDEGIISFKMKQHKEAWKCFDYHASNGNTTAKYWKGRYLWDGYLDNIKGRKEEGKALLKEAADEGIPDAQLRYAFILLSALTKIPKDEDKRIKWLRMAALRNNTKAIDLLKQIGINIYEL